MEQPAPWVPTAGEGSARGGQAGPAADALDRVAAVLVDPQWQRRDGPQLDWWGAATPLLLRAGPVTPTSGRLTAVVHLLDDVQADDGIVLEVLGALNRRTPVGALVFDTGRRRVSAFLADRVPVGQQAGVQAFADLAILMYAGVLDLLDEGLADALDGTPVCVAHPRQGVRADRDRLIEATGARIRAAGRRRNGFMGLADLADWFALQGLHAIGHPLAVTVQMPWTSPVPVVLARAMGRPASGTTAVLRMEATKHPQHGNGLMTTLDIREHRPRRATLQVANELNLAELDGGLPAWGAWSAEGEAASRLVHTSFLPGDLARPGLAQSAAGLADERVRWAQDRLLPAELVARVRSGLQRQDAANPVDDPAA